VTSWLGGDVTWAILQLTGAEPDVGAQDLFWLGGYPLRAAALLSIVRRRGPGRGRAALQDGLTLTTAATVAAWQLFIAPNLDGDALEVLVGALYPVGDLVLLAAVLYLVAGHVGPWIATGLLVVGAGLHTLTELWGSVGEWTVSVDLAAEAHRGKYLAVFGLGNSVQQAVGPAVVAVLIAGGSDLGWPIIGVVTAVACLATATCAVPPGRHAAATVRRRQSAQRRPGKLVPADAAAVS
jgi:hypothetical protein